MSDSEPINEAPVKRGRGRPRKDPSAPAAAKKPAAPAANAVAGDSVANGASGVTKGKRGRKPGTTNKPKSPVKAGEGAAPGAKRGRGRPRKSDATPKKKSKKAASSESEGQDPESSIEESDE